MSVEQPVETLPIGKDAHGVYRIAGSRVTLATLIALFKQGYTAEELAEAFDSLSLETIYLAIGQYLRHKDEYEGYLVLHGDRAERLRAESQARPGNKELREKLLSRRAVMKD